MGIKIILTESQVATLEKRVNKVILSEANLSCTDLSFDGLMRFLNGRDEKRLGHNTSVLKTQDWRSNLDAVAVKYHNTNILTVNSVGIVTINTNGWETNTTKDRLNQFLRCKGMYIYQKKYKWYITSDFGTLPYVDGMQIFPDGKLIAPVDSFDASKVRKHLDAAKSLNIDPKYNELYGID
jgi:cytochrome c biogenesis protein ResB